MNARPWGLVFAVFLAVSGASQEFNYTMPSHSTSSASYSASTASSSSTSAEEVRRRTTAAVPIVTTTLPFKAGRYRSGEIEALRGNLSAATTTLRAPVCGGTFSFCSIEYDSDSDGRPDCCTPDNNPVCECLDECRDVCGVNYRGVVSCFTDPKYGVQCHCSKTPPTCYRLDITPNTTQPPAAGGGGNILVYLFVLGTILFGLAGAVHFLHRTR